MENKEEENKLKPDWEMFKKVLGNRFREVRLENDKSVEEESELTGIDVNEIMMMERGIITSEPGEIVDEDSDLIFNMQYPNIPIAELRKQIGDNIKKYRLKQNMSIEELAQKTGRDLEYIKHMELGNADFSMADSFLVCDALNITWLEFYEGVEINKK